jgi:RES domain-containing protein
MARPELGDIPAPHPDPPSDLSKRELPRTDYAPELYRVHRLRRDAKFFGRSQLNRWDAPGGEFGVMYAGGTPFVAFAETLLPAAGTLVAITVSGSGATVPVSASMVADHGLALVTIMEPLRCVDLRGSGLARLGADARLTSGSHRVAQRWSLAFWLHPSIPDGIVYHSRRDPGETAVAIYDRASGKTRVDMLGGLREPKHKALLTRIYARYGVAELP